MQLLCKWLLLNSDWGLNDMRFLGPILILGSKKITISDVSAGVISSECGCQIFVTKICNGDSLSYILR